MSKIISNKSSADLDYPVVRPSLDLDFTQEELDPRITFSRGSIGTRVNRNRLIETVAANQPRFDYDPVTGECKGLLIEESRQNLLTYSEDFSSAPWAGFRQTILTNQTTSPDGNTTADIIQANQSNVSGSAISQNFTPSITTYTFSVFAKSATTSILLLRPQSNLVFSQAATAYFDLSNGTLGSVSADGSVFTNASSSIQKLNNGWYRCSITFTLVSSAFTGNARIYVVNSLNSFNVTQGASIYVWGAQLETGAFPTTYIPTSGSTVTRSAELADMTGTNFSSWYNQTEGTFFFDGTLPFITNDIVTTGTTARVPYGVSNGLNFSNSIYVSKGTTSLGLSFSVINNNVGQAQGNTAITTMTSSRFKIASSVADKSIYSSGYGGAINKSSRPSASIPTVNKLSLGKEPWNSGASNPIIGCIARFTYYPRALKPNQLQFLTQ